MSRAPQISIGRLDEEPYASVLCYPRSDKAELESRLKELLQLGVTALQFAGKKRAFDVAVWGKGCVGLVVIAYRDHEEMALKIRRVDADRAEMLREAELLKKANSVNVGPRLLKASRNFMLMQFVDGLLFPEWLEKKRSKPRIRKVLRSVLEQCWQLDAARLDHGELSRAPKHIMVDQEDRVFIVDFESASISRRPANVTSACQFLFLGSTVANVLSSKLGVRNRALIIAALKTYKNRRSRRNFRNVLVAVGLQTT